MDLEPNHGFDDNLFPLNPDWAYTIRPDLFKAKYATPGVTLGSIPDGDYLCGRFDLTRKSDFLNSPPGAPPCSSQTVTYDSAGTGSLAFWACPHGRDSGIISSHGHVNWEPGTYSGTLTFESHSQPGTDDDYSFQLATPGRAGATSASPTGIHIEFDSDETIDHFDDNPWWKQFHAAVDAADQAQALVAFAQSLGFSASKVAKLQEAADLAKSVRDGMVNGHQAVVTGLLGLDTAHPPGLESHPVYALAVQTDRKAAVSGGTDTWAIFARNWGNEGFCSSHSHPLGQGPLSVRIPWQDGATGKRAGVVADPARSAQLTGYDLWGSNLNHLGWTHSVLPGEGVLLTFDLNTPAFNTPLYFGTVSLKWTFGPPPAASPLRKPASVAAPHAGPRAGVAATSPEAPDVEVLVARLWAKLPRATRARALALLPKQSVTWRANSIRPTAVQAPVAPLRKTDTFIAPAANTALIALGRAEAQALCMAYNNRVPGFPAMCHR
jgi:hypothetical protein